jgi:hypothetical protein
MNGVASEELEKVFDEQVPLQAVKQTKHEFGADVFLHPSLPNLYPHSFLHPRAQSIECDCPMDESCEVA